MIVLKSSFAMRFSFKYPFKNLSLLKTFQKNIQTSQKSPKMEVPNKFLQKLQKGETIVIGEGYLFEMERRGFLSLGKFIPIAALTNPSGLKELHREFVHCGSDVVLAFTYYAHKERLAKTGQEQLVEQLNKKALEIAKEVIKEPGNEHCLLSGNICNTNVYDPKDPKSKDLVLEMFRDQCKWAKEAEVDLILAETIGYLGEAELALQAIKEVNLPAIINMSFTEFKTGKSLDGFTFEECAKTLRDKGADVVGSNCHLGPDDMIAYGERIRKAVDGPISLIPIPYRTEACSFFHLKNLDHTKKHTDKAFPDSLENYLCTRGEIKEFGEKAKKLGAQVIGLCCGTSPYHVRALCNGLGIKTRADEYGVDMSKHFKFGENSLDVNKEGY